MNANANFLPGGSGVVRPWSKSSSGRKCTISKLSWQAITTAGGNLVITMSEKNNHQLNFQSGQCANSSLWSRSSSAGMLQSWNKLCFSSSAYIEVAISLPGFPSTPGFWPGAWTMGNLGRAGYGATTEGMWPYRYACTGAFGIYELTWLVQL
jgi:beta-glucanase (GH16 family)